MICTTMLRGAARFAGCVLALMAFAIAPRVALADEGGVSFWVPGYFGSLAAVPQQPGFSLATIYYHDSVSAGGDVALARSITIRNVPANVTATASASVNANANLVFIIPGYVSPEPVLGGQFAAYLLTAVGQVSSSINGTLTGTIATPFGSLPFERSASVSDAVGGAGDLAPFATMRWNMGVNNFMAYITGDVPVGTYSSTNIANLGIGHAALDGGGGYTYFDPQSGHEISGVLGFTYNTINPATQYQSGVDMHFDWGASQFLTKQIQVGAVGYAYQEIGCDSGSGDRVGCFQSRVFGAGPQVGYIFPISEYLQGYVNLKGYKEFEAEHRPSGWNVWATIQISPAPPSAEPPKQIVAKY
jgi:hypothetical protein